MPRQTPPQSAQGAAVSVILPVRNGEAYLGRCLDALGTHLVAGDEIIAVDDGSTDGSAKILESDPWVSHLIRNPQSEGAFSARNAAALQASGDILFFTDADCVVQPRTLEIVRRTAVKDTVVIGVYTKAHPNADFVSRYKNAWIRWSYLAAPEEVDWFFSAVGALSRDLWNRSQSFDDRFMHRTGGGDVEFGGRLRAAGARILLEKSLEVTHLKAFTLSQLLQNDFSRAYGWSRLGLSRKGGFARSASNGLANVNRAFVASTGLAGLILLCAAASWVLPLAKPLLALCTLAWLGVNRSFLGWLLREMGAWFALAALPLLFADHVACGFGVAKALSERLGGSQEA